jgi:hypothetical protein
MGKRTTQKTSRTSAFTSVTDNGAGWKAEVSVQNKQRLYCGTFRTEIEAACEVGCKILLHMPGSFATRCLHFEPLGFEVDGCLESIALADISVLVDDSIGPLELSLLLDESEDSVDCNA